MKRKKKNNDIGQQKLVSHVRATVGVIPEWDVGGRKRIVGLTLVPRYRRR